MKSIKLLRAILQKFVDDIDSGNCNLSSEELEAYIDELARLNTQNTHMSKEQAYKYLHLSRATFDRLVADGRIPQGRHTQGFKELSWSRCDLDKVEL